MSKEILTKNEREFIRERIIGLRPEVESLLNDGLITEEEVLERGLMTEDMVKDLEKELKEEFNGDLRKIEELLSKYHAKNLTENDKRLVREYVADLSPNMQEILEIGLMSEEEFVEYGIVTKEMLQKKGKKSIKNWLKNLVDKIGE